ncbi:NADP transhydrogenase subunit alpha [Clostridiales bacterium PH28_bin88]|nr:NADP transhydrogenase subunit alpha [Clostridiales bacterium PH28_bin88]
MGSHQEFPRFCVVGAGNGGLAVAGYLLLAGFPVKLFNRSPAKLEGIRLHGGVTVQGEIQGFARLEAVTSDPAEATSEVDVLMVVIPASGHRSLAQLLAPHLKDGQVVVLNPGRTLGAVEFEHVVRAAGCQSNVVVAEAQTMLYASRSIGPARVMVHGIKNCVPVAALPAWQTERVTRLLNLAFPQFVAEKHVLQTGLDNIGAVLHPAPTILNLARIEAGQAFEYYHEGITPRVARLLEEIDRERLAVAGALGLEALTTRRWLAEAYDSHGDTLHEAINNNSGYDGIMAPSGLPTRYMTEDVPMSLVPIASLGKLAGVPTPAIDSIITLASLVEGTDYRQEGRTLERVGLGDMTVEEVYTYIKEGRECLFPRVHSV